MLKNYFTIAIRHIVRHRAFSLINIQGLAIGMACSMFILIWVKQELSYDRFQIHADRIYRLTGRLGEAKLATSPAGLCEAVRTTLPRVEAGVRISRPFTTIFTTSAETLEETHTFYADPDFFRVFSFRLLQGNPQTALSRPDAIVLTRSTATRYFGNENPMGKIIVRDHEDNLVVTGVTEDPPAHSHLIFHVLMPMDLLKKFNGDLQQNTWENFNFYTYLLVRGGRDNISPLTRQIDNLYASRVSSMKVSFFLQPLTDIHLYSDMQLDLPGKGNAQYVHVFLWVALFVLAVACINFVNLSTARSGRRAKEVGLRKMAGARKYQLILQFMSESMIISIISFLTALAIVWALFPAFRELSGKPLSLSALDPRTFAELFGIAIAAGACSGIYPAFFLSGYRPVRVLKGQLFAMGGQLQFRNTLVVLQFVVSVVFLIGTAVVFRQLAFIKTMNLGFDKENILYVNMTGKLYDKVPAVRAALSANPATSRSTILSELPTDVLTGTVNASWEGKDPSAQISFNAIAVDDHFTDVFAVKVLSGRSFGNGFGDDDSSFVINEAAAAVMGFTTNTAVGKPFTFHGSRGRIIGVVKNFHFKPVQELIAPLVLQSNPFGGIVVVRALPGRTPATIKALRSIFTELNPGYPFSCGFLDQDLANLYQDEQQTGRLFFLFSLLAIIISCLGLYGLSAFLAEQRSREIGIRKVLGASVWNILYLLSWKFTRLVGIAVAIAIPLGWLGAGYWLNGFAYHVGVGAGVFLIASVTALLVAWGTVSYEALRCSVVNPARSLKSE